MSYKQSQAKLRTEPAETYSMNPWIVEYRGFLQNVLRWLLDDRPPGLEMKPTAHHALGNFFFSRRLEVEREVQAQRDQHTIAYVERVLRQTGILKALDRPHWLP